MQFEFNKQPFFHLLRRYLSSGKKGREREIGSCWDKFVHGESSLQSCCKPWVSVLKSGDSDREFGLVQGQIR